MKKNMKRTRTPVAHPPAWLDNVLRTYRATASVCLDQTKKAQVSDAFRARCRAAAAEALVVLKLRQECQQVGFVPHSLAEYLHGLARLADVSLKPWLKTVGLADLDHLGARSARAVARLADEIGLGLKQALVHVRIGLAEKAGAPPLAFAVARRCRSGVPCNQLKECERALTDFEAKNPRLAAQTRKIVAAIQVEFARHGPQTVAPLLHRR